LVIDSLDPTEAPVLQLLLDGYAETLHEAEEFYLDASLAQIYELIASSLDNESLLNHPLMRLIASHGQRGWEDSLL
jgi:hypothetical protein